MDDIDQLHPCNALQILFLTVVNSSFSTIMMNVFDEQVLENLNGVIASSFLLSVQLHLASDSFALQIYSLLDSSTK